MAKNLYRVEDDWTFHWVSAATMDAAIKAVRSHNVRICKNEPDVIAPDIVKVELHIAGDSILKA